MERLLSVKSVQSDAKVEKENEELVEDLPEFSFGEILKLNKPETCFIISKSLVRQYKNQPKYLWGFPICS